MKNDRIELDSTMTIETAQALHDMGIAVVLNDGKYATLIVECAE